MSVSQWREVGRVVVGLGFVIVGIGRQISSADYPAGDWRGDPTISGIVNVIVVLVGTVLIVSAVIPFVRKSGSN